MKGNDDEVTRFRLHGWRRLWHLAEFAVAPNSVAKDLAGRINRLFGTPQASPTRTCAHLLAPLLGIDPASLTQGRMTYVLRRLRLHGLIERIDGTHRCRVTDVGLRTALFFTRAYARLFRPGLAEIMPGPGAPTTLCKHFDRLDAAIHETVENARLAA